MALYYFLDFIRVCLLIFVSSVLPGITNRSILLCTIHRLHYDETLFVFKNIARHYGTVSSS